MKIAKGFIIMVGVVTIAMAGFGIWYNFRSLSASSSDFFHDESIPYFYQAFYIMSVICIACYIALLICGVQFVRLRTGLVKFFVSIIIFEIVYVFSIGITWLLPTVGMSIAAASGVANGGLMIQAISLFFLWAPIIAIWATKILQGAESISKNEI